MEPGNSFSPQRSTVGPDLLRHIREPVPHVVLDRSLFKLGELRCTPGISVLLRPSHFCGCGSGPKPLAVCGSRGCALARLSSESQSRSRGCALVRLSSESQSQILRVLLVGRQSLGSLSLYQQVNEYASRSSSSPSPFLQLPIAGTKKTKSQSKKPEEQGQLLFLSSAESVSKQTTSSCLNWSRMSWTKIFKARDGQEPKMLLRSSVPLFVLCVYLFRSFKNRRKTLAMRIFFLIDSGLLITVAVLTVACVTVSE